MITLKILDLGCGDSPIGDVNLDLFFYVRCENFVIVEAHHLPFKTGVFEKVCSKHYLEHLKSPLQFFKEAKRVLKNGGTQTSIMRQLTIEDSPIYTY
jgi:ubiquinone/menaquinone biosynthesis C-methylase UbiE